MKSGKKLIGLLLVLVLLLSLTACSSQKKLLGTWQAEIQATQEDMDAVLAALDLYEEEVALVDARLSYVKQVRFDENSYSFDNEPEGSRVLLAAFLEEMMDDLYQGRTALNEVYGVDFTDVTEEQFQEAFAAIYGCADYEALMDAFTQTLFVFEGNIETGTYEYRSDYLLCTTTGETEQERLLFKFDGEDTLTLTYSDGVEVYTRVG